MTYTNKSKTNREVSNKIKCLIKHKHHDADCNSSNFLKIKTDAADDLVLYIQLFLPDMVILIRSVFEDKGIY